MSRPRLIGSLVTMAMLIVACADGPILERANEVCSLFSEVRDLRGADDPDQLKRYEGLLEDLRTVIPREYHDEIALWHYPYGGPVGGLDTSGTNATRAGEVLDDIYSTNC